MSLGDELQSIFSNLPPMDEIRWGEGLDGSDIVINEVHIGASGEPERQNVGVPVSGQVWCQTEIGRITEAAPALSDLSAYQHRYFSVNFEPGQDSDDPNQPESHRQADLEQAHTWSSELVDAEGNRTGYHTVMLDIDHPVRVLPSSTQGHYHLYIDVPVGDTEYFTLLDALSLAGIVEEGYVQASKVRAGTHLRLPWIGKEGGGTSGANLAIPAEIGEAIRQSKAGDVEPLDIFAVGEGVDPEDLVDRKVDEGEETARLSRLDAMRHAMGTDEEITFDPAEYNVAYVNGVGVLRRVRR